MKALFLFACLTILATAFGQTDPARWSELMGIVSREIKILEKSKKKRPHLEYRLLELYTEKLKLTMEKNNNTFLSASSRAGFSGTKEAYFQESRDLYQKVENYGLELLKMNTDHPYQSEIAFNMGLNSRDYGKGELTEKMLLESIRSSSMKPARKYLAQAALAEFYFNEQRFAEAIKFYEIVVQAKEESWRAKHYYNLSWAYLKEKKFDQALAGMRLAMELNNLPQYIKIPDQSMSSLTSFYTFIGRPLEAMELFLSKTSDPVFFLLPLARKSFQKGHGKEAQTILRVAQKYIIAKKKYEYQEELYHVWLDFYRSYSEFDEHAKLAARLTSFYSKVEKHPTLKPQMKTEAIEKFRSIAGFLQLKLTKDLKENQRSTNEKDLGQVLSYYQHLIKLEPEKKGEYLYYQGETNYSLMRLKAAAEAYSESIAISYKKKDLPLVQKALYSLLDLAGREELSKEENKKYLAKAYTLHVRLWPKDEKSRIMYPKLFEIFYESKNDKKCAGVLTAYHQAFPEDKKNQRLLMTRVLDQFIESGDTLKLSAWISKFKEGFLSFDEKSLAKMDLALGNLLFARYQQLAVSGKKLEAANGFRSIYENKLYTQKVRSEAAFLAAMSFLEAGETAKSFEWVKLASNEMAAPDLEKHRSELINIAERNYQLQDFKSSFAISAMFLKHHCSSKDKLQQRLYEIAVMTAVAENMTKEAESIVKNYSQCVPDQKVQEIALSQIYRSLERSSPLSEVRSFISRHPHPRFLDAYQDTLQQKYWSSDSANLKKKILRAYELQDHPRTKKWLSEIALFARAHNDMKKLTSKVIWVKPQFEAEAFNLSLDAHLQEHQAFRQQYGALLQATQPEIVIKSSQLFSGLYLALSKKIKALNPAGMDKETAPQFRSAMQELAGQFAAAGAQYDKELKRNFLEGESLHPATRSIASLEGVENPVSAQNNVILMDKGGDQ